MSVNAHVEEQVILSFRLPGVSWDSSSRSGTESQLRQDQLTEAWRLKIARNNVSETLACLREVVAELERYEQILKTDGS